MDGLADSLSANLGAPVSGPSQASLSGRFLVGKSRLTISYPLVLSQVDAIKTILLLLLAVPLSLVFPYLPSSTESVIPDVFAIVPSAWFMWSVLKIRSTAIQLVTSTVVCWLIVKLGRRSTWMPWAVFAVAMGHLAVK